MYLKRYLRSTEFPDSVRNTKKTWNAINLLMGRGKAYSSEQPSDMEMEIMLLMILNTQMMKDKTLIKIKIIRAI